MPKASKPTGGKDIRMFFGGGSQKGPVEVKASQLPSSSKKVPKEKVVIDISDNDITPPSSSTKKAPISPTVQPTVIVDSDDEHLQIRKPTAKRRKISTLVSSDDEDEASPPAKKVAVSSISKGKEKPKPRPSITQAKAKKVDEDYEMDSPKDSSASEDEDDYEEEEEDVRPKKSKKAKSPIEKSTAKRTKKVEEKVEKVPSKIPEKSKSELEDEPKKQKYNWAAAKAAKLAGPVAHGSKEIPDGAPDCLAGLAFVFTGELSSFSRDEAIDVAKRFGGRVVGQPSSKTDYVVLGDNAGPAKLAAIKKHGIRTLSEDEFLKLIATRKGNGGALDEKTKKKMEKEQEEIQKVAREMEKREKKEQKDVKEQGGRSVDPTNQLWTTRYAPQSLKDICGNKGQVEKLQLWLHDWSSSLKSGFTKPGRNGMNIYRAVLITGSPGIGKTTSAHLCAKLEGFTPIELNASDTRSKKLVESGMNINNTSLDGYIHGVHSNNAFGVPITDKTCLIMDEVDGMSAGDRGGVGALNALIKKTKIPIICIANDRTAQKLKPLQGTTYSLTFQKPQVNTIRSRILSIAFKEKMKVPANVIDQLITGAQSDIRQVLNMLSTWKLSNNTMDFDEGKNLVKMNEKYSIMSPFDITSKMLGPYLFSSTSRETLGDKIDYYFQDHSFVPLFIQENYLKTQPAQVRNLEGPEKVLKQLELMERASASISDGDLVDALIHGPEQHWGLMPLHAVCSTVRPAAALYGMGAHYGGPNSMSFPQWLGQNSKQNKLNRQLGDVQVRMRLKVSGDKSEIRQSYIPALFPYIVKPLMDTGASAVDEVIERMDNYFISKEDWDTIVELGVDEHKEEAVLKKLSAATKTSLTRKYNASEHPIPFHKAEDLGKVPKKLSGGPAPDIEDAFIDDVEDVEEDDSSKSKDETDISNDKLIQLHKKKAAAKGKGKAKQKA